MFLTGKGLITTYIYTTLWMALWPFYLEEKLTVTVNKTKCLPALENVESQYNIGRCNNVIHLREPFLAKGLPVENPLKLELSQNPGILYAPRQQYISSG